MFSKSNKFKNKQTSTSNSEPDGTAGSSNEDEEGYELLVENGEKYEDAVLHFVGKVTNDRSFEKLFKLRMVCRKRTVIFYIRHDNLYLVGFEIVGGLKYEFGRKGGKRLIKGSIFLEYEGSYLELEEASLVNIRIDYWALAEAINKLAEGKDRVELVDARSWLNGIKKYLARVVVMFPESARFKWVFVRLVRLMALGASCPRAVVEPWMPGMFHGWEDMSKIAADLTKIADVGSEHWAADALVVPKQTLSRRKKKKTWWVTVKLADSAGAEEIVEDEWTNIKRRFPDYDDGLKYN